MVSLSSFILPSDNNIRSIREINGEIEDGSSDVLVFNNDVYYPLINIDPKSIIKPSVSDIKSSEVFIENETSLYKKAFFKWRSEGCYSALKILSSIPYIPNEDNILNLIVRNLVYYLLYIWEKILLIYVYFYPYALLSQEDLCNEFCKYNDFNSVIRNISWHPKKHKVALALLNDNVYIYSSNLITPILKHPIQKKITDMKWNPMHENLLAIACTKGIIIWNIDPNEKSVRLPISCAKVLNKNFEFPIICIEYENNGNYLAVCSPSSSKLLLLNLNEQTQFNNSTIKESKINDKITDSNFKMKNNNLKNIFKNEDKIIKVFGYTVTFVNYSPDNTRICVASTEFGIRVYETETFTWKNWGKDLKSIAKSACWNQVNGKILLFALKNVSKIFAIIFYDKAEAGYVGGTNTYIPVLDVKETELDSGVKVGGLVQHILWDQNAGRLVVSFFNNPHYIAIYKTKTKPSLEITSIGFIHGLKDEIPLCLSFHFAFKKGALLTVCWSGGYVSHIPLQYDENDKKNDKSQLNTTNLRSLTSFCVSQTLNEESFNVISPENNYLNITKRYLTQDSIISPRKPVLFTNFNEDLDKSSFISQK